MNWWVAAALVTALAVVVAIATSTGRALSATPQPSENLPIPAGATLFATDQTSPRAAVVHRVESGLAGLGRNPPGQTGDGDSDSGSGGKSPDKGGGDKGDSGSGGKSADKGGGDKGDSGSGGKSPDKGGGDGGDPGSGGKSSDKGSGDGGDPGSEGKSPDKKGDDTGGKPPDKKGDDTGGKASDKNGEAGEAGSRGKPSGQESGDGGDSDAGGQDPDRGEGRDRDHESKGRAIAQSAKKDPESTGKDVAKDAKEDSESTGLAIAHAANEDATSTGKAVAHAAKQDARATGRAVARAAKEDSESTGLAIAHAANADATSTGKAVSHAAKQDARATGRAVARAAKEDSGSIGKALAEAARQDPGSIGKAISEATKVDREATGRALVVSAGVDPSATGQSLAAGVSGDSEALALLGLAVPVEPWLPENAPVPGPDPTGQGEWQDVGSPPPIDRILARFPQSLPNAKVLVTDVLQLSAGVPELPAGRIVAGYLTLDPEGFGDEEIGAAHATFFVGKSFLDANQIHQWSVQFSRFDEERSAWTPSLAKRVREDEERVFYSVGIPGFSLWAISGSTEAPTVEFSVNELTIQPAEPEQGQELSVRVLLTNLRSETVEHDISLWLNSTISATKRVLVGGNDTVPVTFTIRPKAGVYNARVDRLLGSFSVRLSPPPPSVGEPAIPGLVFWLMVAGLSLGAVGMMLLAHPRSRRR